MKIIATFEITLKKITYIFVAFLYLILAVKLKTSIHFCGGNFASISFFQQAKEFGCECSEMAQNSCCNDLTLQFQVSESDVNLQKSIVAQVFSTDYESIIRFDACSKSVVPFISASFKTFLNFASSNRLNILSTIFLRI